MERREFLKVAAMSAGATLAARDLLQGQNTTNAAGPAERQGVTVGIATAVAPLAGPDLPKVLDDMQQRGGVNAVFPFIYNHNPDRAGIQPANCRGGNYAIPHMQYYRDTNLTYEDMRGAGVWRHGLAGAGIARAPARDQDLCLGLGGQPAATDPKLGAKLYEIDFHGRRSERHPGGPCNNNPLYRNYLLGLVEDYTRSYDD